MHRARKYAISLVLILALGAAYLGTQTPTFAVYRIAKSIEDQDPATFREYVNVERVVTAALEDIKALDLEKTSRQESLMGMIGAQLQGGLVDLVKMPIMALVNREIDRYLTSPDVSPPMPSKIETRDALIELTRLKALLVAPEQGEVVYVKRDGSMANVGVKVHSRQLEKDFLLNFTLEKGRRWQIVRLSNLLFTLAEITRGEADLLQRHNAKVRAQLAKILVIGPLHKDDKDYGWGLVRTSVLSIPVENKGEVAIRSFHVAVSRRTEDATESAPLFSLHHDEALTPGARVIVKSDTNLDVWGGHEKTVTQANVAELQAAITRLTFADGRVLEPVTHIAEIRRDGEP